MNARPPFPAMLLRFWLGRILPGWCLIALMIFLMQIAVCGIVHDNENVKTLLQFLDVLPGFLKAALGGESLQVGNLPSLIAIGHSHPLVLSLFMLFAVATPTGMLAGEVQRGTMELILSRRATKTQVYVCAGVVSVTGMVVLVMVMFLGTAAGTSLYDFGQPVRLYPFFQLAVNGGLLAGTIGAVSLLTAAAFRRRGQAVGVAVAFIVLNYFVAIISGSWPRMRWLSPWTIMHYVNGRMIFVEHRWPVGDMFVLAAILTLAAIVGAVIWQRRDLPL